MNCGMTFEYLNCRADLNFEVDFGVNGAIKTIVTKWDLILFGEWIVFIHIVFFFFFLKYASFAFRAVEKEIIFPVEFNTNMQYSYKILDIAI